MALNAPLMGSQAMGGACIPASALIGGDARSAIGALLTLLEQRQSEVSACRAELRSLKSHLENPLTDAHSISWTMPNARCADSGANGDDRPFKHSQPRCFGGVFYYRRKHASRSLARPYHSAVPAKLAVMPLGGSLSMAG